MTLGTATRRLALLLQTYNCRIVFAESCTGGLVAASLARVPGISAWHCGSLVTYRNGSKEKWLGIPAAILENPGPVSEIVARQMAEHALQRTPEAKLAAAVTGHLGPGAPAALDGVAYIGIALGNEFEGETETAVIRYQCLAKTRVARQREVAAAVLAEAARVLEQADSTK